MILIAFAAALIVSAIVTNWIQSLLMKFIGADVMFFKAKTKLVIIVVLALLLLAPFHNLF